MLALSQSVSAAVFAQQKIPCASFVTTKSFIPVVLWSLISGLGCIGLVIFNRLVFFA
ncbi:30S ribosomal protein S1 [marine gamma proteobacterium HTCC2080]|nr:30S ribosomal protein S1 [marine gamma proteobacterium HTCC2080]